VIHVFDVHVVVGLSIVFCFTSGTNRVSIVVNPMIGVMRKGMIYEMENGIRNNHFNL
jgi:hypothetical protein